MEQNSEKDGNETFLEASVVENDENAGKDEEVVVEAEGEKDENEVVDTSAGEKSKEDEKVVETFMDAKPEDAALKVVVEENKKENETVEEPSVFASVEASSSGVKKPQGLRPKTKIVKKVKRLVKKKILRGTSVQVAGEEIVAVMKGVKDGITAVNIKKDEQTAEPFLGESEKEIKKVIEPVADSLQCSSGKEKDSETSIGVNDIMLKNDLEEFAEAPQPADDDANVVGEEPSGKKTLRELKRKTSILKSAVKRLQKGKKVKGTLAQGMDKESAPILQVPNEGVHLGSAGTDEKDTEASSPEENAMETEKAIDGSIKAPENVLSVEKKQPRKQKAKAKLRKTPAVLLIKNEADKGTPRLEQNNQKNNNSIDVNEQRNGVDKLNSLEVDTSGGGQQKTIAEENKQNQLTEEKTGLTENKRRKRKRQRKPVLDSNKKQREEVAAADVTNLKLEEWKEQLVDTDKRDKDGHGQVKIGGLIFMCNTKTRPDCFRFSVMGVQEKRKDYVMGIKPGLKLFLYDYDLKLLYGIFQASSVGGMKLERNAFGGSFPAQVRFKVFSDCIPLPESQFRKAIKENYNKNNKFKTELTHKQVFKLKKLFRLAPLPAQIAHTQPICDLRDADRKRSDKDRYAPGSSRAHTHERRRNASPPPRREEPPRDLYLSEREYRTYGLRRGETNQHYPIPPPDSSHHSVNRDRVPLDLYHPSVDHDRLLRNAEIERHDRNREVRLLRLPERDYHPYDHLSSRREILARHSPDPPAPAVARESYRRDHYHSYDYRAPEKPRTYPVREDDDLYSRYVTADSLAEYYRSSSFRYPSMPESELPPSLRYDYSRSSPYSRRL